MDEMHIKADLVYDKFSGIIYYWVYNSCVLAIVLWLSLISIMCTLTIGALLGFTNLGDIDTRLTQLERSIERGKSESLPLTNTMLVFMVRGLFSGLQFPYAQFPCASLSGDQLFPLFWEAVARLERYGVKVLGLTCDGLAANRRFFKLHNDSQGTELTYKVPNPYTDEPRPIYFMSDPPHLLKTVRNCWANKHRHLWVSVSKLSLGT